MKWSLRLGKFFGIPVFIHFTFLAFLGLFTVSRAWAGGLAVGLSSLVLIVAVFASVLLHEFGHALMARRYGIRTHDITLLPIGGLARLARMPANPRHELWIALAGPAVNVAIAALLFPALLLGSSLLLQLFAINVGLVLFNMLPAFPMDGGRVLRALLVPRMGFLRATETASVIGKVMAGALGIAGLFFNPMLILIAFFVWFGAGQEVAQARARAYYTAARDPRSIVIDVWDEPSDGFRNARG